MTRPVFGWEEQAELPELGAPRLIAKIDTGARLCALHALEPRAVGPRERPQVRFKLPPALGGRLCRAPLLAVRRVRSSNGASERRFVVRTALRVGGLEAVVEMSLADRSAMRRPLLIGRDALAAFGALVDPSGPGFRPAPH